MILLRVSSQEMAFVISLSFQLYVTWLPLALAIPNLGPYSFSRNGSVARAARGREKNVSHFILECVQSPGEEGGMTLYAELEEQ